MVRTTFIAVTGSVGKTSCKDLIAQVLGVRYRVVRTRGSRNHYSGIAYTIFSVRPWHRFAVIEVGLDRPGQMVSFASAIEPDIAVWVSVARTHTMNFKSLDVTAREKSKLVEGLRPGGFGVLNDDNAFIADYVPPPGVRVIRYGSTERSAMVPSDVSSRWPERLSLNVQPAGEEAFRLQTRFVGEHWTGSILPALVVARECGVPLKEAAAAIEKYETIPRRMSPVVLPNGATILRDENNGSVDTLAAALKVLEDATALRKILVMTDVSDSPEKPRKRVRDIGRAAAGVADAAIFLGEHSEYGKKGAIASGMREDQVWNFYNIEDAARHLRSEVRSGDLVLLRGRRADHTARMALSFTHEVTCWRNRCTKGMHCDECPQLSEGRLMRLVRR